MSSIQRYQTEKAIIDALLKISEIIKKTTIHKSTGDGDKRINHIYHTPKPPSTRTFESYVSGFNRHYPVSSLSSQRPTNWNRSPIVSYNSRNHESSSSKRHRYDSSISSSLSDNHYRKKSSRYYAKHRSDKRRRMKCHCQNEYSASDC